MKNIFQSKKNLVKRVALFYISANLFNVWPNRRFSYLLLHSICCTGHVNSGKPHCTFIRVKKANKVFV